MAKTILLADDSVTIRKVVELTFSDTDIRVESVGSGREALQRLDAIQPDLVLADVGMAEPTGYDVCKAVKGSDRPVPVLLLAGTFDPYDPGRAEACGADGHLVKPFESRALLQRVEQLLAAPEAPFDLAGDSEQRSLAAAEVDEVLDDLAAEPAPETIAVGSPMRAANANRPEAPPEASPPAGFATDAIPLEAPVESAEPPDDAIPLGPGQLDAVARAVVARLSDQALREIAWEVVPDLAETIIRERLREIERESDE